MTLDPVEGYEWHEATSIDDLAHGRRVLVRGAPLDPNRAELEKLKVKIKAMAEEYRRVDRPLNSVDIARMLEEWL